MKNIEEIMEMCKKEVYGPLLCLETEELILRHIMKEVDLHLRQVRQEHEKEIRVDINFLPSPYGQLALIIGYAEKGWHLQFHVEKIENCWKVYVTLAYQ